MKQLAALAFALLAPFCASAQYNSYTSFAAGTAFDGPWDASKVHVTAVGTGSFTFDSPGRAHFSTSGEKATGSLDMIRMQFAAPASVCR